MKFSPTKFSRRSTGNNSSLRALSTELNDLFGWVILSIVWSRILRSGPYMSTYLLSRYKHPSPKITSKKKQKTWNIQKTYHGECFVVRWHTFFLDIKQKRNHDKNRCRRLCPFPSCHRNFLALHVCLAEVTGSQMRLFLLICTIHGNPKPSFLGVITSYFGV